MTVSVHMPPAVDVECDKCGDDLGPAFIGQEVYCQKCKRWVLAEGVDEHE